MAHGYYEPLLSIIDHDQLLLICSYWTVYSLTTDHSKQLSGIVGQSWLIMLMVKKDQSWPLIVDHGYWFMVKNGQNRLQVIHGNGLQWLSLVNSA